MYLFFTQADPTKPVLVAGDPERAHMSLVDSEGGIRYHVNQISASVIVSEKVFLEHSDNTIFLSLVSGKHSSKTQR